MKKLLLFLTITLIFVCPISGQIDFQEITTNNLPAVSQGATALADVDGDNDLDLFITGNQTGTYIAKLFLNDGTGIFSEVVGTPFIGVTTSSVAFADIDGDNDQDVMYIGLDNSLNRITKLYRNDGTGIFTEVTGTPFAGLNQGSITFSDIDSDSDLDLILSGEIGATGITKLYINDGLGNFTEVNSVPFIQVSASAVKFSDIDNDNDNDLLITGFNGNYLAKLYLNNGSGVFTEVMGTPFDGVAFGAIEFVDIDNDLDDDVIISGRIDNTFARLTNLYINDGSGNFSIDTSLILEGVEAGSLGTADINNDNEIDLILTGLNNNNVAVTKLYTNIAGALTETFSPFEGIQDSRIQLFADIDNDNDSDVLIFGANSSAQVFGKIYRNIPLDVINHPDYPALLALYNATNGANWTDNTNWLDVNQPISSWFGITETNGRVTDINLGSNNNVIGTLPPEITTLSELKTFWIQSANLTGEIPSNIGDLVNLTQLVLNNTTGLTGNIPASLLNVPNLDWLVVAGNELEGNIPDFTSFNLALFFINDNKFQFGDFENEFTTYLTTIGGNFPYSPQKKISVDQSQIVSISDNVTFDAIVSGNNNVYQWYFNDTVMAGEINNTLTLNNIQTSQFGTYRCDITNTEVTGLTLQTGNFNIGGSPTTHPDYPALLAFYNALDGNNWTNNTNWLDVNQPIASWFGITETNGRVTDIDLNQNNLRGNIPPEIGDLSKLYVFSVRLNSIWGKLPSTFFNLINLEFLDLNSNQIGLLEALPPEIGNFTNLTTLDLGWNLFTGNIPVEIANMSNIQSMYLHRNTFSGSIPTSLTTSTTLQILDVSFNNLTGLVPDFTSIPPFFFLNSSNNNFLFADLETNFNALSTLGGNFIYSPQNKIGNTEAFAVDIGNSINLNVVSGLGNSLSVDWYKDESGVLTFISSGLTLNVPINSASDYGVYKYFATSSIVTGLTLESNNITLGPDPTIHPDYNALVAVYNALDGSNWIIPWDITAPINNWDGTNVLDFDATTNRLIRLDLSGKEMLGTIPPEIGNLTELRDLWLFLGDISGEVPAEIWTLSNLVNLVIGAQGLPPDSFASGTMTLTNGIPTAISNLQQLEWLNLTGVALTLPLQPELFNLPNLIRLRLANCGLTGILPAGFATIDNVIVSGNNFEGVIPPEILNSTGNSFLDLTNNFLDFADLEPLVLANNYTTLGYTPQRTKDVAQTVSTPPGNDIVLSVDDTTIGARTSITAAANNEYQWFKDNVAIAGANASIYTIFNAQPTDTGVYFCEITNPLLPGLIITRADITVNVGTFSIEDNELNALKIYPNPARNILNIKLSNYLNTISTNIYDVTGKLILSKNLNSAESQMDVSQLQNGIYFIRIETENTSTTKRFIKQ